jgi:CRP-like cAMP-binding protein
MSLAKMEQDAKNLIKQGETELAVKYAYNLSIAWAKKKNFKKATAWREQLIAINPNALGELLETSEVIEAEKDSTIDYRHQKVWENFYFSLNREESIAFFLHLKRIEFPPGKVLIKQGRLNDNLYLIDNGKVKVVFNIGGKEIFINELTQGDSAGEDTFFNVSNCTSTAVVTTPSIIRYFDRAALDNLERAFPGVANKLKIFCLREGAKNTGDIIRNSAIERRIFQRHKLKGKIGAQFFNDEKKPIGPMAIGSLEDISVGGASFSIKSSNANIGRRLLGKPTALSLQLEKGPQLKFNGHILGARYDQAGTYTTHLKFFKPFVEEKLKQIASDH